MDHHGIGGGRRGYAWGIQGLDSLWTASDRRAGAAEPLRGDHNADVVVVGGGAAGLSVALRLQEAGADVVVLERHRVGGGVTGGSTAKLTALHGVVSSAIRRRHGDAVADTYLTANQAALADIRAAIDRYGIDCALTTADAVDYATTDAGRAQLDEELAGLRVAGLPAEWADGDLGLPFSVRGAVVLPDQAHLDPVRWCEGMAAALTGGGGRVHEGTAVHDLTENGDGCTAVTGAGVVRAGHAVVATHAPIVDPRYLAVRCRPHRSYALAARIEGTPPAAMFLGVDPPVRSLRPALVDGVTYLVVAGEGHPVGDETDARRCLDTLEAWAREHFPVVAVDHRWAAHDQMPSDDLPFVGRLTPGSRRWVITGFQKWGLTSSGVAAAVIAAGVAGGRHPATDLLDPTRLRSTLTPQLAAAVGRVASRFTGDHVHVALRGRDRLGDLESGDGMVVRDGVGGIAAYRDPDGRLHLVSAVCTHEGCLVRFNRAQTSWDCPCHGSRFSVDGEVLSGPAVDDLPAVQP